MIKDLPENLKKALEQPEKDIDFSDFQKAIVVKQDMGEIQAVPVHPNPKIPELNKKELKQTLDCMIMSECKHYLHGLIENPGEMSHSVHKKDDLDVFLEDVNLEKIAGMIYELIVRERVYDQNILEMTRAVNFNFDYVLEQVEECCESMCKKYEKSQQINEMIDVLKAKKKPFSGYNPKKHSKTGGLNTEAREKYNKENNANLKRPVTKENPKGKDKKRKDSFCARMSGVDGPNYKYVDSDKDGKKEKVKTPKKAALDRWNCKAEKEKSNLKKKDRCWEGYEPVPGKKPYSDDSCKKKSSIDEVFDILKAEKLVGGKADNKPSGKYDKDQLAMGIKHEMEHTNDPQKAAEIAKDHLEEDPKYYTKLKKIETEKACGKKHMDKAAPKGVDEGKYKRCKEKVKKESPNVNEYAVCTASLKKKSVIDEVYDIVKGGPGSGKHSSFSPTDSEKVFQREAAAIKTKKDEERKLRSKVAMAKLMMELANRKVKKSSATEVIEIKCDCDGAANCKCNKKPCKEAGDGCDRPGSQPLANPDDIITQ